MRAALFRGRRGETMPSIDQRRSQPLLRGNPRWPPPEAAKLAELERIVTAYDRQLADLQSVAGAYDRQLAEVQALAGDHGKQLAELRGLADASGRHIEALTAWTVQAEKEPVFVRLREWLRRTARRLLGREVN